MADTFNNPDGEEVERLDDAALTPDFTTPAGTCFVRGRPYLTMEGMLKIADSFERKGDQAMADSIRQRVEARRNDAYERFLARGLTGNKAGLIVTDEIGAAVPERDPVPGYVRLGVMIFAALVALAISSPVILRAAIAFFSGS